MQDVAPWHFTVIRRRVLVPHSGCRSCWLVSGKMWPRRLDNIFVEYIDCIYTLERTDKKENQIVVIYNEIQNGSIAKSHMTNGLLIHILGTIYAFPHIRSPSSYMTLQMLQSEFPNIWGKFSFLFYQSTLFFMWHFIKNSYVRHPQQKSKFNQNFTCWNFRNFLFIYSSVVFASFAQFTYKMCIYALVKLIFVVLMLLYIFSF